MVWFVVVLFLARANRAVLCSFSRDLKTLDAAALKNAVTPERVWVETATFAPEKRNLNYHRFRYLMLAGCDWWISFPSLVNMQEWRKFWKRFRGCLAFQSRISTKTVVRFALCKRWPKQVITTDTVRESGGFAVMTSFKNTRELLAGAY